MRSTNKDGTIALIVGIENYLFRIPTILQDIPSSVVEVIGQSLSLRKLQTYQSNQGH